MTHYIAYYRVSTKRHSNSGHGLKAQRKAIQVSGGNPDNGVPMSATNLVNTTGNTPTATAMPSGSGSDKQLALIAY